MDVGGRSHSALIPADSNPGRVHMSPGGVGRNIAHNMALLGLDTRLVTVLGDDLYAEKIAASCSELGIDLTVTYKESRNVDLKKTVLDNTKIRELYKKPLKPFREGLREYYEFLSGCR